MCTLAVNEKQIELGFLRHNTTLDVYTGNVISYCNSFETAVFPLWSVLEMTKMIYDYCSWVEFSCISTFAFAFRVQIKNCCQQQSWCKLSALRDKYAEFSTLISSRSIDLWISQLIWIHIIFSGASFNFFNSLPCWNNKFVS